MIRFPALLLVLAMVPDQKADGVALIEFENASKESVEAEVGEKKYIVKAKSSQKVFLTPGVYECKWKQSKLTCRLKHGDITVIEVGKNTPEPPPKKKVVPKGPVVIIPEVILKSPPKEKPPPKVDKIETEPESDPPPNAAVIKVTVPKGSTKIWFNNEAKTLDKEKTEYIYYSPALKPGQRYRYKVRVETPEGNFHTTIYVSAGDNSASVKFGR